MLVLSKNDCAFISAGVGCPEALAIWAACGVAMGIFLGCWATCCAGPIMGLGALIAGTVVFGGLMAAVGAIYCSL